MDQRLSVITLGVADVGRAQAFYESLGWHVDGGVDDDKDHIVFFQTPGMILSLWDRAKLAEDGGIVDPDGWGGVTIGHCVGSPERGGRIGGAQGASRRACPNVTSPAANAKAVAAMDRSRRARRTSPRASSSDVWSDAASHDAVVRKPSSTHGRAASTRSTSRASTAANRARTRRSSTTTSAARAPSS